MRFTKQDAVTFAVGLGVSLAFVMGQSLMAVGDPANGDPTKWAIGLGTGLASAAGRYLITYLTQRGFSKE